MVSPTILSYSYDSVITCINIINLFKWTLPGEVPLTIPLKITHGPSLSTPALPPNSLSSERVYTGQPSPWTPGLGPVLLLTT